MFQRWESDTRYYLIHVQVDLFGATTLRRVWGGLLSARGGQILECIKPRMWPGASQTWPASAGAGVTNKSSEASMDTITVPAEKWERLTSMYSSMLAGEQGNCCDRKKACGPDLVKVKTAQVGGRLYTSFGICHGGLDGSYIEAWELCPELEYPGSTHIIYHDQAVVDAGLRGRGDHEGLLVACKGKRYVLTQPDRILIGLPSIETALSLEEAKAYDKSSSRFGWRALWCKGSAPRWMIISGFPAAIYTSTSGPPMSLTMLYYDLGKRIAGLRVNDVSRFEIIRQVPTASPLRAAVAKVMRLRLGSHNRLEEVSSSYE
jgi:hypothetical protein